VLYGGGLSKRTPAVVVGIAGFLLWAAFYVACDILPKGSHALAVMFLFWSLPKYFVGFSMILKTSEDATEEMGQQAREFRELYEDFRMTFESHPHPMWICSLETGALLSVNAATVQEYGFSEPELLGMRLSDLELPNMPAQESGVSSFPRPFDGSVSLEHRQRHGGTRWVNVVERQISFQGQPARLMLARDITERVKLNRELEHRANHDALTGMLNRPAFDERIPKCLARCDRDGRKAAMLTIDVDHFKQINDTYGHQVGDQCLQIVAARLNSRIRQVDSIARTGGEEFGAIVGGMHAASDAMKIADSLLKVFAAPLRLGKLELWVTVSIGVAVYPDDGDDAEILLRRSDEALYRAKRRGRNQAAYAGDADLAIESADGSASFADAVLVDSSLMDVDLA
jgi:diguanylate cyclase (GGDEF)-like protein/PAS domain S-box-containing protein